VKAKPKQSKKTDPVKEFALKMFSEMHAMREELEEPQEPAWQTAGFWCNDGVTHISPDPQVWIDFYKDIDPGSIVRAMECSEDEEFTPLNHPDTQNPQRDEFTDAIQAWKRRIATP